MKPARVAERGVAASEEERSKRMDDTREGGGGEEKFQRARECFIAGNNQERSETDNSPSRFVIEETRRYCVWVSSVLRIAIRRTFLSETWLLLICRRYLPGNENLPCSQRERSLSKQKFQR